MPTSHTSLFLLSFTAPTSTQIYTLSLHDALPIYPNQAPGPESVKQEVKAFREGFPDARITVEQMIGEGDTVAFRFTNHLLDRKSTRLNSSHVKISYAVFCLKKKIADYICFA